VAQSLSPSQPGLTNSATLRNESSVSHSSEIAVQQDGSR